MLMQVPFNNEKYKTRLETGDWRLKNLQSPISNLPELLVADEGKYTGCL
jgi:hypothetical protein